MMPFPMEPGRVVYSRAGRDRGRAMMILSREDEFFVHVADGDLRKLESPKKKKVKHLRATPQVFHEIIAQMQEGKPVVDADIRNALEKAGYRRDHRELACKEGEFDGEGR